MNWLGCAREQTHLTSWGKRSVSIGPKDRTCRVSDLKADTVSELQGFELEIHKWLHRHLSGAVRLVRTTVVL